MKKYICITAKREKKIAKNKYHNFKTKYQNLKKACKEWRKKNTKKLKNHYKS